MSSTPLPPARSARNPHRRTTQIPTGSAGRETGPQGDDSRAGRRSPSAAAGWIAAGLCLLLAAGCATTARDRARTAELAENFDEAVVEYTRALQDRPDDRTLQRDLRDLKEKGLILRRESTNRLEYVLANGLA